MSLLSKLQNYVACVLVGLAPSNFVLRVCEFGWWNTLNKVEAYREMNKDNIKRLARKE